MKLALDTSAAIAYLRTDHSPPPQIDEATDIVVPLPAVGELYAGAHIAHRRTEGLAAVERILARWPVLSPDVDTARVYGRLRAELRLMPALTPSKINDLWIAALCLQHALPLLTNDRGFDAVPGLTVLHW